MSMYTQDFSKPVGLLSQSCFLSSVSALTGTAEGCGVIWKAAAGGGGGGGDGKGTLYL